MTRFTRVSILGRCSAGEAKPELMQAVQLLGGPERFQLLGDQMPLGVLLVGPPGAGNALLARAVEGEGRLSFFCISGPEFVELLVGVGAGRVHDHFRRRRRSRPVSSSWTRSMELVASAAPDSAAATMSGNSRYISARQR